MLFGVESYFRVEIEELIDLNHNLVFVSQNTNWTWDKLLWNTYAPNNKPKFLTFLNGDRTIINDKSNRLACNYIFSSKVLEYNKN